VKNIELKDEQNLIETVLFINFSVNRWVFVIQVKETVIKEAEDRVER